MSENIQLWNPYYVQEPQDCSQDYLSNNYRLSNKKHNSRIKPYEQKPSHTSRLPITPQSIPTTSLQTIDDKDGHYIVKVGTILNNRYKIISMLGQGTFGKVVKCLDLLLNRLVAIKIIRNVAKYREASKVEIKILEYIKLNDPLNLKYLFYFISRKCITLNGVFDFNGHVCMVFDLLDLSLFDFLKFNEFQPFPIYQIQEFGKQILNSIAYLHRQRIIHTDLKPENILLLDSSYSLGSIKVLNNLNFREREIQNIKYAIFSNEYHSSIVSTRHYRAPEIILGLGWSFPCDMWSLACILVEFFTGEALFQTHDNLEHLVIMEQILGSFPNEMKQNGEFFSMGKIKYPNSLTSKSSIKFVKSVKPLSSILPPVNLFNSLLLDLVKKLFVYQPSGRLSADEALNHDFFFCKVGSNGHFYIDRNIV